MSYISGFMWTFTYTLESNFTGTIQLYGWSTVDEVTLFDIDKLIGTWL